MPWWSLSELERSGRIEDWKKVIGFAHAGLRRLLDLRYAGPDERPGFEVYPLNEAGALGQVEFQSNGNLLYKRKVFYVDGRVLETLVR